MKFRKYLSSVLIAVLLFVFCTATAAFAGKRVLQVGNDATLAPFDYVQDGEFVGFDVDLMRAIAREAGYEVKYQSISFDGLIPALQAGTIDLVASAMYITDERAKKVDFTDSYYASGQSLMVSSKNNDIHSFKDLEGKTIAVLLGSEAARVAREIPGAKIVTFNTQNDTILEVMNFGADATISDTPALKYILACNSKLSVKIVGDEIDAQPYGIAVKKGNSKLLAELNEALRKVRASGEYDRIYDNWFGKNANVVQKDFSSGQKGFIRSILPLLLTGALLTLKISALSIFFGLLLGLLFGLMHISSKWFPRMLARAYIGFIRGTPLLVQIFIVYFALPQLFGHKIDPYFAAISACSLNCAAYIAEIIRAGIQSVDKGQFEAGESLGLSWFQTMRFVVIPQAWKNSLPSLCNQYIAMLKDSSLVSVIGFEELTRKGQLIIAETFASVEVWSAVALIYLIMTIILSQFVSHFNKRRFNHEQHH